MKKVFILLFVLLLILLHISGTPVKSIARQEGGRYLLFPQYNPNMEEGNKLRLSMRTERMFSSGPRNLIYKFEERGDSLFWRIEGIETTELQYQAFTHAGTGISLDSLYGDYILTISSYNFSDNYKLIIGKNTARLVGDTTANTKPMPFVNMGE